MTPSVTIRNRRDGTTLVALLDGEPPTPGPYGGWEEVGRPRRKSFPDWNGQPLLKQTIPLRFDLYSSGQSVELFVRLLEQMASTDGVRRPPTIKLRGPIRRTELIYVIEDIGWRASRRTPGGLLTYQAFDLAVMEWEEADVLKAKSTPAGGGTTFAVVEPKAWRVIGGEQVVRGENLLQVVARALGSTKKWHAVAKLNGITDPRHPLKVGRRIRLP